MAIKNSLLILLLSLGLVSACASQPQEESFEDSKLYQDRLNSKEIKHCKKNGGVVQRAGRMGLPHCVMSYKDADKACKDSSECTGRCLLAGNNGVPAGSQVTGKCQQNSLRFGCSAEVKQGVAGPVICVD